MLLPRKWALGLGLLAAVPSLTVAGPLESGKAGQAPEAAASASETSNQQVADQIAQALVKAKLAYRNVQIEYNSGTAIITGEIQDASQRATVSRVVGKVPGVQNVENRLSVMATAVDAAGRPVQQAAAVHSQAQSVQRADYQGQAGGPVQRVNFESQAGMSNQAVAQQIAESMASAGLSGYDIEIRYKNGVASLIGSVDDKMQAARAEQAASSVPGVGQVLNRLTVKGRPVDIQGAGGMAPPGAQQYAQGPGPQYAQGPQYPQGPGPQYAPPPGYPIQQAQAMMPGVPPQPVAPQGGMPPYGNVQPAGHHMYNQPNVPDYAWPSYAPYDNSAAVTYPSQYDASAWPYIGPYYPYPQVPMGWRKSTLEWDDGNWSLKFDSKTDKWWWFLNPHNWH